MFPKLYNANETNFIHNGIGLLRDSITAVATEELNGMFELKMEYDSEGFLVNEIKEEMIIKAKANDKQDEQLFRIYSITKNHENDNLIIDAQHITYDLANNFVEKMEAGNLSKKQVMEKIGASTAYPHKFNLTSTNTTTFSSTSLYRTNPLQMIGGMDGSVLQIWGGQIERDNFNLIMHDRRGSDDGVLVTYKKNLTGLNAVFDISNLVTRIFPFVYKEDENKLITVNGKYIDSPLINDYENIYIQPIDYSHDERVNLEGTDEQIRQQLTNLANSYYDETGNDIPKVTMDVKFEHLWETEEYEHLAVLELVGMGDTVTIEHSRLKVNATAIVNYIRYDCIAEKNEEVRLGSVKARLTDSVNKVVDVAEKAEQAQQTANQAIKTANGKNTIYYGPDEPTNGIEGDLWFRVVDGEYTRTYRHDGIQWQLVLSVDVRDAIDEAQQAKDDAQQAVDRANQATQQATNAINQAQTAFDEAQQALSTAGNAYDIATTLQGDVTNLSTLVDEHTGQISSITQSVTGLQTQVSDIEGNVSTLTQTVSSLTTQVTDIEGNITVLQQTSSSLAGRLTDAEGNITSLTATVSGLQTTVSNVQGDVSSVTQLANALQTRMTDAEGNISTLTQTASSLESTITSLRTDFDDLEIGGRNLILNSKTSHVIEETYLGWDFVIEELDKCLGKQVTFSFEARSLENEYDIVAVYFRGNGTYYFETQEVTNEWDRYSLTFLVTEDMISKTQIAFHLGGTRGGTKFTGEFRELKLEKGNKATDWSPAVEDMATQTQITQLSDAINLRVAKGDVINQINLDTSGILISGKKLILDGDTTVLGTFKLDGSAHIKDASIGTAQIGTIDAAIANIINISANSIVGGILQSQNSNTTFNLNSGELSLENNNITLNTSANINFISSGNRLTYRRTTDITRSAGLGVGIGTSDNPYAFLGTTGASDLDSTHQYFSGFIASTTRSIADGGTNSINGYRLQIRNTSTNYNKGITFDWYDDTVTFINGETYNYDMRYLSRISTRRLDLYNPSSDSNYGYVFTTTYGNEPPAFRGRNADTENYYLGRSSYRWFRIYSENPLDVPSDQRLKSDIQDLTLGLDFINGIEIKSFLLNRNNDNKKQFGVIAQQLESVLIEHGMTLENSSILSVGENGYYSIQYEQLIAPTIKAIQELDTKLNDKVSFLKLKIQYLEQKIKLLEETIV